MSGVRSFADLLSFTLKEHQLTQQQLAKILDVSQGSITQWMRGKSEPSEATRQRIVAKLQDEATFAPRQRRSAAGTSDMISITISGDGLEMKILVSKATARQVLQVLMPPND